ELLHVLSMCGDPCDGDDSAGMAADKLARIEKPRWDTPVLSFLLERHGGLVVGSSRAEVQSWEVSLETRTASSRDVGHRQKCLMERGLKVGPIANRLMQQVLNHEGGRLPSLEGGRFRPGRAQQSHRG